MSRPDSASFSCSQCGLQQTATTYSSVNASRDPELKSRILSGKFFTYLCKHCGKEARFQKDLLYHDMEIPAAIWLVPGGDISESMKEAQAAFSRMVPHDYKLRVVYSDNELIEAIIAFDCGLHDITIQALKHFFIEKKSGAPFAPWYFSGVTTVDNSKLLSFIAPDARMATKLPMDAYCKLVDTLSLAEPAGEWLHLDYVTVVLLLNSSASKTASHQGARP